jgi:hypothetical protein
MDVNNWIEKTLPLRRMTWIASSVAALLLIGCAQTPPPSPTAAPDSSITPTTKPPVAITKEPEAATPAPQVAKPVQPAPAAPASAAAPRMDAKTVATTSMLTPDGKSRYECATGASREVIELPSNTLRICSRFPAMGPCQYERDACRAKGGRVIRFDGIEITKEVELEYDRQVQRFRLNAG